jgi:hypothetical protein
MPGMSFAKALVALHHTKGRPMLATYLVAFFAMLLAAVSAVTLIRTVNHFDPPEMLGTKEGREQKAA